MATSTNKKAKSCSCLFISITVNSHTVWRLVSLVSKFQYVFVTLAGLDSMAYATTSISPVAT